MPLYEYQCEACGRRFEVIQKFSDPPADSCRLCGAGPVQRLFSSPAIQFKGTGWYITDYSRKGKSSEGESSGASKSDSSDAKTGDVKTSDSGDAKTSNTGTSGADSSKPAQAAAPAPTKTDSTK